MTVTSIERPTTIMPAGGVKRESWSPSMDPPQTRVLSLNDGEHQEHILYRLQKGYFLVLLCVVTISNSLRLIYHGLSMYFLCWFLQAGNCSSGWAHPCWVVEFGYTSTTQRWTSTAWWVALSGRSTAPCPGSTRAAIRMMTQPCTPMLLWPLPDLIIITTSTKKGIVSHRLWYRPGSDQLLSS